EKFRETLAGIAVTCRAPRRGIRVSPRPPRLCGERALAARAETHPPHEKILRGRERGERGEAEPAREPQRRIVARKNPRQPVGKPDPAGAVEPPPRRIAGEELRRADAAA